MVIVIIQIKINLSPFPFLKSFKIYRARGLIQGELNYYDIRTYRARYVHFRITSIAFPLSHTILSLNFIHIYFLVSPRFPGVQPVFSVNCTVLCNGFSVTVICGSFN